MADRYERTRLLVGSAGLEKLRQARVAVVGLGGVGGYALEALARAGVGHLLLIDGDRFEVTNLNRQLMALHTTLGLSKVEVARTRVRQINPDAQVEMHHAFLTAENMEALLPARWNYAVDAIDAVAPKTDLIAMLHRRGARFVTCMGAACKLNPFGLKVEDISETKGCPLARAVRQNLKKLGIESGVRCVYSEENLARPAGPQEPPRRHVGSISYLPGVAGLIAAAVLLNDILKS